MVKSRNEIRGTISAAEIKATYRKAFNIPSPNLIERTLRCLLRKVTGTARREPFYLADSYYRALNETTIRQILSEDKTNLEQYTPKDFDCDDFAFRLMGAFHQNIETAAMPIFVTWVKTTSGAHAVLSFTDNRTVLIIEPQNDRVYPVPAEWQLSLLCG